MHFGIFMEFGFRDGGSEAEAFREGFELADAAEAWGSTASGYRSFISRRTARYYPH